MLRSNAIDSEYHSSGSMVAVGMTTIQVRPGSRIAYNDGRAGHTGVEATVLESDGQWMMVQFDDRADTTTINLFDRQWMDFIRIISI